MIEKISKFGFGEHKNSFVATTETPGASSSFVILFASAVPITGRFLCPKSERIFVLILDLVRHQATREHGFLILSLLCSIYSSTKTAPRFLWKSRVLFQIVVSQRYRFGLTTNVRFSKSLGKLHVLCPLDETNNNNPKRKGESSRGCVEIFTILANQKDSVTISKQAESIKLDPLLSSKPWTLSWAALLVALFPDVLRGRKTHRICGQVKRVRVQVIECEGQVRLPLVGQFQSVVCLLRTLNQQDLKVFPRPETWFTAARLHPW